MEASPTATERKESWISRERLIGETQTRFFVRGGGGQKTARNVQSLPSRAGDRFETIGFSSAFFRAKRSKESLAMPPIHATRCKLGRTRSASSSRPGGATSCQAPGLGGRVFLGGGGMLAPSHGVGRGMRGSSPPPRGYQPAQPLRAHLSTPPSFFLLRPRSRAAALRLPHSASAARPGQLCRASLWQRRVAAAVGHWERGGGRREPIRGELRRVGGAQWQRGSWGV